MDFKDYYKILGVEPTADDKEIKAAYRKLARKYHPDVSKEKDAEAKFKDASEAYEALKSADKRAEYDDLRKYGQHGQPFQGPPGWQSRGGYGGSQDTGDFSDFFSSIFGPRGNGFGGAQGRSAGRRGQDVEMELPVFLEETLSNESKPVTFQVPQYNAAGQHVSNTTKSLNVKIPAGVADGERIRLKGQGAPGIGGGAAGGQAFGGTHIAGEGLRLPPLKLYDQGEVRDDLLAIIMNNTRTPHFVKGDLQAHVGCLKAAQQEMERAAEKYGTARSEERRVGEECRNPWGAEH